MRFRFSLPSTSPKIARFLSFWLSRGYFALAKRFLATRGLLFCQVSLCCDPLVAYRLLNARGPLLNDGNPPRAPRLQIAQYLDEFMATLRAAL